MRKGRPRLRKGRKRRSQRGKPQLLHLIEANPEDSDTAEIEKRKKKKKSKRKGKAQERSTSPSRARPKTRNQGRR